MMDKLSRRSLIIGGLGAALVPRAAIAAVRTGFIVDWQGGAQTPAIVRSVEAQIALVEALPIKPEITAFFAEQPIFIDTVLGSMSRAGARGVTLDRQPMPPANPVLLHELLHRYHALRLPAGADNDTVARFFDQALSHKSYPPNAYMYSNRVEFFAMVASVVLHGSAARPPAARKSVATNMPEFYRWIVTEFGLRL